MTRLKVLLFAVVGAVFLASGSILAIMIDFGDDKGCLVPRDKGVCENLDVLSQVLFLTGGVIIFVLVVFPIIVTLVYPYSRDERRRRHPQLPDEAVFEALIIKDWKKNG